MIARVRLTKTRQKSPDSAEAPAARLAPFGPPPLIEGEDAAAYDELLGRISAGVQPADILEDIWVRDIVDLVWDVLRLRRLKANLMTATAYRGLEAVLSPLIDEGLGQLVGDWARRKRYAVDKVNRILASANLTLEAVIAHTLPENIDFIERIERLIAGAEARRNAILREIDRHRESLARPLRRNLEQIEGEYQVVKAKSAKENNAA